jgi:small-conductance mechanosensitive channel
MLPTLINPHPAKPLMTQEDKSEDYMLTATATFPFAILFALAFGFMVNIRILLSIPFILIGYGIIILPILDLAGMHKLNTIGAIVYALLTALYITLVAILLEFYNVQWMALYTGLGILGVIAASGCTYILLDRGQEPCGLE